MTPEEALRLVHLHGEQLDRIAALAAQQCATFAVPLDLTTRLSQACPGWSLQQFPDGYVLTPPDGAEALISTRAALEDWLSHQEHWQASRAKPRQERECEAVQTEMGL